MVKTRIVESSQGSETKENNLYIQGSILENIIMPHGQVRASNRRVGELEMWFPKSETAMYFPKSAIRSRSSPQKVGGLSAS